MKLNLLMMKTWLCCHMYIYYMNREWHNKKFFQLVSSFPSFLPLSFQKKACNGFILCMTKFQKLNSFAISIILPLLRTRTNCSTRKWFECGEKETNSSHALFIFLINLDCLLSFRLLVVRFSWFWNWFKNFSVCVCSPQIQFKWCWGMKKASHKKINWRSFSKKHWFFSLPNALNSIIIT